ncbi:MAG TPA: MFS transporter [Chthonomonadaceae bacterium]|nr:MFS transporter [Chthonomonadaceae bacterium]
MNVTPPTPQPEPRPQSQAAENTAALSRSQEKKETDRREGNGSVSSAICVQRLMLAIVLVAGCAELAYAIVNLSAMPVYVKAIGHGEQWVGAAAAAYLVAEGVLKSPFGLLGDRVGRKALIVIGPCISIFTALLTPFVQNPYVLVMLRLVDGMGAAALWPAAFSLIGDHVPGEKRASAMSLFNLSYMLGVALGPAIGGNVNDWASQHLGLPLIAAKSASFYAAAAFFTITTVVALTRIPHVRPIHHDPATGLEVGFDFKDFWKMLYRMPATLAMAFVTFLGIGLIMAYTKVYAMDPAGPFHLSESAFGNYLIFPSLVIALVSVPLGTLGDRIGKAKAVRLGIGLCAGAFWGLILHPAVWTLLILGSVIGIGFVIAFPAWMALVSGDCDPKQRGAVVGAVGTAQGLGAILGVGASSFLYKLPALDLGVFTIPEHGLPFLGCALMLALSFLLALLTVHDSTPGPSDARPAGH